MTLNRNECRATISPWCVSYPNCPCARPPECDICGGFSEAAPHLHAIGCPMLVDDLAGEQQDERWYS